MSPVTFSVIAFTSSSLSSGPAMNMVSYLRISSSPPLGFNSHGIMSGARSIYLYQVAFKHLLLNLLKAYLVLISKRNLYIRTPEIASFFSVRTCGTGRSELPVLHLPERGMVG